MTLDKRFGWKAQRPDIRDLKYGIHYGDTSNAATFSDLSTNINWMYDQGNESSCVAQSSSSLIRYQRKMQKLPEVDPSRNFIYWCGRAFEGDTNRDAGMVIRDAMIVLANSGYCTENTWAYAPSTIFLQPSKAAYAEASENVVGQYVAINQDHQDLRASLSEGNPVVVGITVYQSMMTDDVARSGNVPMPSNGEPAMGGHAILLVGHDDSKAQYKLMNSWGSGWGQKGFFTLPYDYLENGDLAADFWTITGFKTISDKKLAWNDMDNWWV